MKSRERRRGGRRAARRWPPRRRAGRGTRSGRAPGSGRATPRRRAHAPRPERPASARPTNGRAGRRRRPRAEKGCLGLGAPGLERDRGSGRRAAARLDAAGPARPQAPARRFGSTNVTSRPAPSRAVMKRNWSPSGKFRSTIAVAIFVSRYRSTARLSGRAPSSALKPCSIRKSTAASSHSTAQGCIRKPRRRRTPSAPSPAGSRMISRPSGRKTTTRSRRFRNSGRNDRSTDFSTGRRRTCRAPANPSAGAARDRGPEIGGEDDHAVAHVDRPPREVGQPPVVEHLQEHVPDALVRLLELVEQQDGERLPSHRRDQRRRPLAFASRRRGAARGSPGSGTRSCRAGSADPASRRGTR